MKARSFIALTFTASFCMLIGESVVAQDLRIIGTNLYDFSGISTLGNTDTPYIVAGIVQEATRSCSAGDYRVSHGPPHQLGHRWPREMLGAMVAAKMAEKPLTAGQVFALSPDLRQYVKKIEHVRDAILLNYPEPCQRGQNLRACAVPVDGKPSVYDYGVPIELSLATTSMPPRSGLRPSSTSSPAYKPTRVKPSFGTARAEGRVYSQFLLGLDYWCGQGTQTNQNLALHWLRTAAIAGSPEAKEFLRTNSLTAQ